MTQRDINFSLYSLNLLRTRMIHQSKKVKSSNVLSYIKLMEIRFGDPFSSRVCKLLF